MEKQSAIDEALKILMGENKSGGYYLAGFILSLLAILLSVIHSSRKRNPQSPNTPYKFNLWFMLWDNGKRAVAGVIVIFFMFRLFDCSNIFAMIGVGFFAAAGLDKVIEFLMEKTNIMNFLQTDRTNFPPNKKKEDEAPKL